MLEQDDLNANALYHKDKPRDLRRTKDPIPCSIEVISYEVYYCYHGLYLKNHL